MKEEKRMKKTLRKTWIKLKLIRDVLKLRSADYIFDDPQIVGTLYKRAVCDREGCNNTIAYCVSSLVIKLHIHREQHIHICKKCTEKIIGKREIKEWTKI